MFKSLYPDRIESSVYLVDFEKEYNKGYRGIIFDVDNTLVKHGEPATADAIALFVRLRKTGFATCLMSNNKETRVKLFAQAVSSEYIFKANKPAIAGYINAMKKMGTEVSNTLFIGDQLFTDIWGANRTGLYSILVNPIDPKEEIQIVLKRCLERPILYFYRKRQKSS